MNEQQHHWQKSPQKRFLLLLKNAIALAYVVIGCMILFWTAIFPAMTKWQRVLFGAAFVVYGIFRSYRNWVQYKSVDEEEI